MKIFVLLVGWCVILAQAEDDTWGNFQTTYQKTYKNPREVQLRQKSFNDNLQIIEEHNKKYEQGLVSYKLGVNQFADLTNEEFSAKFKTLEVDETLVKSKQNKPDLTNNGMYKAPESIDWRTKSVVTDVKNQENCGGCWAFSTTGTIESQLAIKTGKLRSLSEQQLLDCDTSKNGGCGGGVVQYAIDYITQNGITSEENYPYEGRDESCSASKTKDVVVKTKGYVEILRNNETDLKEAVGLVGPVSVAINAGPIQLYQGGIFDGACSDAIDHAVLAVGYGKDSQTGKEYWIVKNSWGKSWGESGYFKLLIGRNLCGVARQSCYPLL